MSVLLKMEVKADTPVAIDFSFQGMTEDEAKVALTLLRKTVNRIEEHLNAQIRNRGDTARTGLGPKAGTTT